MGQDSSSIRANRGNSNNRAEENEEQNNAAGVVDAQVVMKKGKKFIKFKDYIIKLPNSMGIGHKGNFVTNNAIASFVDPPKPEEEKQSSSASTDEAFMPYFHYKHIHPNQRFGDKGYSIYVVDDEHEIHRFNIDTYEWSIVSTTKDAE